MRYFLIFLITIGLIILIFIIILKAFSSAPSKPSSPLTDYSNTSTVVELTINGPVTNDQNHNSVQMIVGQTQNEINLIQGYQNDVISTKSYPNNSAAYGVFLRSIDFAGYRQGNSDPNLTDYRGYCPNGNIYIYQVLNGNNTIEQYWSTTCGNLGTFKGNSSLVLSLFEGQFPDFGGITSNANLATPPSTNNGLLL
jgi:hypothetical protein